MKRVLIITYWYPPKNVIGAIRLAKFAKYLPRFGWEPIVSELYDGASDSINNSLLLVPSHENGFM